MAGRRHIVDTAYLSDEQLAALLAFHDFDEDEPSGSPTRATRGGDTHDESSTSDDDGHTGGAGLEDGDADASSVLHLPALRIAWAVLLGVLARRPPGNHVALTLDIAVTTVRACAVSLGLSLWCDTATVASETHRWR